MGHSHYPRLMVLWSSRVQSPVSGRSWSQLLIPIRDHKIAEQRYCSRVITWLDWHTHPRTSHTNISDLRSVILSLFYSAGPGCAWCQQPLPGPEKHRVLSKLNRIKYSGSEWKAWHWNVVGSWCGCWRIWININNTLGMRYELEWDGSSTRPGLFLMISG